MAVKITSRKDRPGRRRVQLRCKDPSLTEQAHKESCDIRNIMARATPQRTNGTIGNPGMYGDFSDVGDYQSALNRVISAQEEFESLDPKIRGRFKNNPALLMEFLENPDNLAEAIELGICETPQEAPQPEVSPAGTPTGDVAETT